MKLKSSIVAIIALSGMSFAGGDLNGVTEFENNDYIAADAAAEVMDVEPTEMIGEVTTTETMPVVENVVTQPKQTTVVETPTPVATPTPVPVKPAAAAAAAGMGIPGLYVGGALAAMAARCNCDGDRANVFSDEDGQDRQMGITGILGYDFMEYLGAELRASMAVSGEDDDAEKIQQYGIYLKPNVDITDALNLYGLLGYSSVNMSDCMFDADADPDNTNSGFSYGAGLDYGITENISVFTDIVNYLRDDDKDSTWGTNLGLKYNF